MTVEAHAEPDSDVLIDTRRRAVSVLGWLMWLAAFGALALAASAYSVFAASLVLIVAELRDAAGIDADWIVVAVVIAAVALPILAVTVFLFESSRRARGAARRFWGDEYSRALTRISDAHHDVYLQKLAACEQWCSKLTTSDVSEVRKAVLAHIERDIVVRATAVGLVVGVSRSRFIDALTIFAGAIELQFRVLANLGKRANASTFLRIVKSAGASLFVNTWLNREQIFIVNVMMKKIAMGVEMTGELATTIQESLADADIEADLDGFLDEVGFESAGVFGKLADAGLTTAGFAVGIGAIGLRQLAAVVEDAGDELLQGVLAGGILYYQGIKLAADVLAADARRTPFDCVRSVARTAGELLRDYVRERRRAYRERRVSAMRRVPKSMWERLSAVFSMERSR